MPNSVSSKTLELSALQKFMEQADTDNVKGLNTQGELDRFYALLAAQGYAQHTKAADGSGEEVWRITADITENGKKLSIQGMEHSGFAGGLTKGDFKYAGGSHDKYTITFETVSKLLKGSTAQVKPEVSTQKPTETKSNTETTQKPFLTKAQAEAAINAAIEQGRIKLEQKEALLATWKENETTAAALEAAIKKVEAPKKPRVEGALNANLLPTTPVADKYLKKDDPAYPEGYLDTYGLLQMFQDESAKYPEGQFPTVDLYARLGQLKNSDSEVNKAIVRQVGLGYDWDVLWKNANSATAPQDVKANLEIANQQPDAQGRLLLSILASVPGAVVKNGLIIVPKTALKNAKLTADTVTGPKSSAEQLSALAKALNGKTTLKPSSSTDIPPSTENDFPSEFE